MFTKRFVVQWKKSWKRKALKWNREKEVKFHKVAASCNFCIFFCDFTLIDSIAIKCRFHIIKVIYFNKKQFLTLDPWHIEYLDSLLFYFSFNAIIFDDWEFPIHVPPEIFHYFSRIFHLRMLVSSKKVSGCLHWARVEDYRSEINLDLKLI
jgi:phosphate starvation-inducible membrane PsiE